MKNVLLKGLFAALALSLYSVEAKQNNTKAVKISKNKTICGNLNVKGDATFNGQVTAKDGLTVDGQFDQNHISYPLTKCDIQKRANNGLPEERHDIIIVGAGTAGSLLTFRLAERYPTAKILVLDVGQDDVRIKDGFPTTPDSVVPNPNPNNGAGPDAWGQFIRSNSSAFGEGCQSWQQELVSTVEDQFFRVPIQYSRGATLGGTSAVNGLFWNRGTKEGTYDRWVAATGDPAFGFDPMVESYKKIENRTQTTRYFGGAPLPFWYPNAVVPGQKLNDEMGVDGRMYLTINFLQGYSERAFNEAASEKPFLPGRSSTLEVNLADVDVTNPVEYGFLFPQTQYSQADPNFPSFNPYGPTTPGTSYTPPVSPPGITRGPEYAGSPRLKQLYARAYAAPVYLYPILDNKMPHNVTIVERAYVTRLLFDPSESNEVIGVEYVVGDNGEGWQVAEINRAIDRDVPPYKGTLSASNPTNPFLTESRALCSFDAAVANQAKVKTKNAYAKADIWLCAGAVDSPALMLRSGIGPQDELESLRTQPVDVHVHLPGVGASLQDSMDMAFLYFQELDLSTGLPAPAPAGTIEALYSTVFGLADGSSLATASINGAPIQVQSFLRIRSNPSKPFNDCDVLSNFANIGLAGGSLLYQDITNIQLGRGLNVNFDTIKPVFDRARWGMYAPLANPEYLHFNASLVEYWDMKSQGQVTINSGNLFARPEYAPNMGADEDDLVALANVFENTLFPLWKRCASKRFGPRGTAPYRGVATDGTIDTITLQARLSAELAGVMNQAQYDQADFLKGKTITITSGAGIGQTRTIQSWSGAPDYLATMTASWATAPAAGSGYTLGIGNGIPLDSVEFTDNNHRNFVRMAHPHGDEIFSEVTIAHLANNPLTTTANSTRVTVHQPNHGYVTGDMVKMGGVTGPVNGSPAKNFNDYHIVYVRDDSNYDIILFWNLTPLGRDPSTTAPIIDPSPAPTSSGAAGGNTVTVSTLRFDEGKFRTWLKSHYFSGWHGCSTARMGKANDAMAVVDTRARVFDTKGLRVSDCSIFPVKPNANTQAPAYGITQRLFELISVEEYDHLLS